MMNDAAAGISNERAALDEIKRRCEIIVGTTVYEYPGYYDPEVGLAHSILCLIERYEDA